MQFDLGAEGEQEHAGKYRPGMVRSGDRK
jgi:hypothetical protein